MENIYLIGIIICVVIIALSFLLKMIKTYARFIMGGAGMLGLYHNTTTLPTFLKQNDTSEYYVLNGNKVKEISNDSLDYYKKRNIILKREK